MKSTTWDFGLGDEVGRGGDEEVEARALGVVGEKEHVLFGGVGDVCADEPLSRRLVGEGVVYADALLAGEAPELAHAPGASGPAGAERDDVSDVVTEGVVVDLVVGGERGHEGAPLAAQVLPSPVLGLALDVCCHDGGLLCVEGLKNGRRARWFNDNDGCDCVSIGWWVLGDSPSRAGRVWGSECWENSPQRARRAQRGRGRGLLRVG